jgi:hypothetical protein
MEAQPTIDELYNLDIHLARIILPYLKAFKTKNIFNTIPNEAWDKIMYSFTEIGEMEAPFFDLDVKNNIEIQEGLDLFAKYFRHLYI